MNKVADRYRNVAARFDARVKEVPADKWDAPTPCEGWVTRDVVKHLAEWVPSFFANTWGLASPTIPSADDDPVATWDALNAWCQSKLDDRDLAASTRDTPMGTKSFEDAFEMIALSDFVIHTWDLARGAGLDDTMEQSELGPLIGMKDMPAEMRGDFFGPAVDVPGDADDQTKALAATGRRP